MFSFGRSSSGRSRTASEVSKSKRKEEDEDETTSARRRSRANMSSTSLSKPKRKSSRREDEGDGGSAFYSSTSQSRRSETAPSGNSTYATAQPRGQEKVDDRDRERALVLSRRTDSAQDYNEMEDVKVSRKDSRTTNKSEKRRTPDDHDDRRRTSTRLDSDAPPRRESRKQSDQYESSRALSNHDAALPQNQFFSEPSTYTAPYRPPLVGHASEYYGDQGESVQHQPGVRPNLPSYVVNQEQLHLQTPTLEAKPPDEPSASGRLGAAASFFAMNSASEAENTQSARPPKSGRPSQKTNKPRSSPRGSPQPPYSRPSLSNSAFNPPTAAAMDYFGAAQHAQLNAQHASTVQSQSRYHGGPETQEPAIMYGSSSRPPRPLQSDHGVRHYGTTATMGLAGAAAGAYISNQHQEQHQSSHQPYLGAGANPNFQLGQNQSASHGQQSQKLRRKRTGPLDRLASWWNAPGDVAQFEEYTEAIGVCKDCFDPQSRPGDGPRKHHYHRRLRREPSRHGSNLRVDKPYRNSSSDDDHRKRSSRTKKVAAAGLAGLGAAKLGETLYNSRHDFDDTHSVKSGKPIVPQRTSYTSYSRRDDSRLHGRYPSQEDLRVQRKDSRGKLNRRAEDHSIHMPPRRRSSGSSEEGLSRGNVASVAVGAAGLGLAAEAAHRRRSRSRSHSRERPSARRKYFSKRVSPKHSYLDLTSTEQGTVGFGSFFSSPSANAKKGKKTKGIFAFSNASSSSSDADLAFGEGTVRRRSTMKVDDRDERRRKETYGKTDAAAIMGLAAAGAVLASQTEGKGKDRRYADRRADGTPSRNGRKIHLADHETTNDGNDDVWEDASDHESASSVDMALAYGGRLSATQSKESLASQSSGTGKWDWRWQKGKKEREERKLKRRQTTEAAHRRDQTIQSAPPLVVDGTDSPFARKTSAQVDPFRDAGLTGIAPIGILGAATASGFTHGPPPVSASMQYVPPMPIQDTSTPQPENFASASQVPLQQPQPMSPILSQTRKMESVASRSPEEMSLVRREKRSREDFENRKISAAATSSKPLSPEPLPFTASMLGRNSVTWDLTPEQLESEQRAASKKDRQRRKLEKEQRRRTTDLSELQQTDKEDRKRKIEQAIAIPAASSEVARTDDAYKGYSRRASVGGAARSEAEIDAEISRLRTEQKRRNEERKRQEVEEEQRHVEAERNLYEDREPAEQDMIVDADRERQEDAGEKEPRRRKSSDSGVAAAAVSAGVGIAAIAAMSNGKGDSPGDDASQYGTTKSRRKSITKVESSPRDSRSQSRQDIVSHETQEERIARKAARRISRTPSPVHEDYSTFFVPEEIAKDVEEHNSAAEHRQDIGAHVVDVTPASVAALSPRKRRQPFDPLNYEIFGLGHEHDPLALPWKVPMLGLVEPTPPGSRNISERDPNSPLVMPSPKVLPSSGKTKDAEDAKVEVIGEPLTRPRSASKVTWGDHDTYVYEVRTPEYERNDPVEKLKRASDVDGDEDLKNGDKISSQDAGAFYAGTDSQSYVKPAAVDPEDFYRTKPARLYTLEDDDAEAQSMHRKPRSTEPSTVDQRTSPVREMKDPIQEDHPPDERGFSSPEPTPVDERDLADLLGGKTFYQSPFAQTLSDIDVQTPKPGLDGVQPLPDEIPVAEVVTTPRGELEVDSHIENRPNVEAPRLSRSEARRAERALSSDDNTPRDSTFGLVSDIQESVEAPGHVIEPAEVPLPPSRRASGKSESPKPNPALRSAFANVAAAAAAASTSKQQKRASVPTPSFPQDLIGHGRSDSNSTQPRRERSASLTSKGHPKTDSVFDYLASSSSEDKVKRAKSGVGPTSKADMIAAASAAIAGISARRIESHDVADQERQGSRKSLSNVGVAKTDMNSKVRTSENDLTAFRTDAPPAPPLPAAPLVTEPNFYASETRPSVMETTIEADYHAAGSEKPKKRKSKRGSEISDDVDASRSMTSLPSTKDEESKTKRKSKHRSDYDDDDDDDDIRSVASTTFVGNEDPKSRRKSKRDSGVIEDDDIRSVASTTVAEDSSRGHSKRSSGYGDDDDTKSVKSMSSRSERKSKDRDSKRGSDVYNDDDDTRSIRSSYGRKGKKDNEDRKSSGFFSNMFSSSKTDVNTPKRKDSKTSRSEIGRREDSEESKHRKKHRTKSAASASVPDLSQPLADIEASPSLPRRGTEPEFGADSKDRSTDDGFVSAPDEQSFLAERPEMPLPTATKNVSTGTDGVSGLTRGEVEEAHTVGKEEGTQVPDGSYYMADVAAAGDKQEDLDASAGPNERHGQEPTIDDLLNNHPRALSAIQPDFATQLIANVAVDSGEETIELSESMPKSRPRALSTIQTVDQPKDTGAIGSPRSVRIPLFKRPPITPRVPQKESASSPIIAPSSPLAPKNRQSRPKSTEFSSREFRPLYLVERHTPVKADTSLDEELLPALPASRSTSVHDSIGDLNHLPEHSLSDSETESKRGRSDRRLSWQGTPAGLANEILDSRSATPIPGERQRKREQEQQTQQAQPRGRREIPKYLFHSPSELLQDPMMLAEFGHEIGEPREGSPLPSVVSTVDDQEFVSAESRPETPTVDWNRSPPSQQEILSVASSPPARRASPFRSPPFAVLTPARNISRSPTGTITPPARTQSSSPFKHRTGGSISARAAALFNGVTLGLANGGVAAVSDKGEDDSKKDMPLPEGTSPTATVSDDRLSISITQPTPTESSRIAEHHEFSPKLEAHLDRAADDDDAADQGFSDLQELVAQSSEPAPMQSFRHELTAERPLQILPSDESDGAESDGLATPVIVGNEAQHDRSTQEEGQASAQGLAGIPRAVQVQGDEAVKDLTEHAKSLRQQPVEAGKIRTLGPSPVPPGSRWDSVDNEGSLGREAPQQGIGIAREEYSATIDANTRQERAGSYVPSEEDLERTYNDLGALEMAFAKAVHARGLPEGVTRDEALEPLLPKRNNQPFVPKDLASPTAGSLASSMANLPADSPVELDLGTERLAEHAQAETMATDVLKLRERRPSLGTTSTDSKVADGEIVIPAGAPGDEAEQLETLELSMSTNQPGAEHSRDAAAADIQSTVGPASPLPKSINPVIEPPTPVEDTAEADNGLASTKIKKGKKGKKSISKSITENFLGPALTAIGLGAAGAALTGSDSRDEATQETAEPTQSSDTVSESVDPESATGDHPIANEPTKEQVAWDFALNAKQRKKKEKVMKEAGTWDDRVTQEAVNAAAASKSAFLDPGEPGTAPVEITTPVSGPEAASEIGIESARDVDLAQETLSEEHVPSDHGSSSEEKKKETVRGQAGTRDDHVVQDSIGDTLAAKAASSESHELDALPAHDAAPVIESDDLHKVGETSVDAADRAEAIGNTYPVPWNHGLTPKEQKKKEKLMRRDGSWDDRVTGESLEAAREQFDKRPTKVIEASPAKTPAPVADPSAEIKPVVPAEEIEWDIPVLPKKAKRSKGMKKNSVVLGEPILAETSSEPEDKMRDVQQELNDDENGQAIAEPKSLEAPIQDAGLTSVVVLEGSSQIQASPLEAVEQDVLADRASDPQLDGDNALTVQARQQHEETTAPSVLLDLLNRRQSVGEASRPRSDPQEFTKTTSFGVVPSTLDSISDVAVEQQENRFEAEPMTTPAHAELDEPIVVQVPISTVRGNPAASAEIAEPDLDTPVVETAPDGLVPLVSKSVDDTPAITEDDSWSMPSKKSKKKDKKKRKSIVDSSEDARLEVDTADPVSAEKPLIPADPAAAIDEIVTAIVIEPEGDAKAAEDLTASVEMESSAPIVLDDVAQAPTVEPDWIETFTPSKPAEEVGDNEFAFVSKSKKDKKKKRRLTTDDILEPKIVASANGNDVPGEVPDPDAADLHSTTAISDMSASRELAEKPSTSTSQPVSGEDEWSAPSKKSRKDKKKAKKRQSVAEDENTLEDSAQVISDAHATDKPESTRQVDEPITDKTVAEREVTPAEEMVDIDVVMPRKADAEALSAEINLNELAAAADDDDKHSLDVNLGRIPKDDEDDKTSIDVNLGRARRDTPESEPTMSAKDHHEDSHYEEYLAGVHEKAAGSLPRLAEQAESVAPSNIAAVSEHVAISSETEREPPASIGHSAELEPTLATLEATEAHLLDDDWADRQTAEQVNQEYNDPTIDDFFDAPKSPRTENDQSWVKGDKKGKKAKGGKKGSTSISASSSDEKLSAPSTPAVEKDLSFSEGDLVNAFKSGQSPRDAIAQPVENEATSISAHAASETDTVDGSELPAPKMPMSRSPKLDSAFQLTLPTQLTERATKIPDEIAPHASLEAVPQISAEESAEQSRTPLSRTASKKNKKRKSVIWGDADSLPGTPANESGLELWVPPSPERIHNDENKSKGPVVDVLYTDDKDVDHQSSEPSRRERTIEDLGEEIVAEPETLSIETATMSAENTDLSEHGNPHEPEVEDQLSVPVTTGKKSKKEKKKRKDRTSNADFGSEPEPLTESSINEQVHDKALADEPFSAIAPSNTGKLLEVGEGSGAESKATEEEDWAVPTKKSKKDRKKKKGSMSDTEATTSALVEPISHIQSVVKPFIENSLVEEPATIQPLGESETTIKALSEPDPVPTEDDDWAIPSKKSKKDRKKTKRGPPASLLLDDPGKSSATSIEDVAPVLGEVVLPEASAEQELHAVVDHDNDAPAEDATKLAAEAVPEIDDRTAQGISIPTPSHQQTASPIDPSTEQISRTLEQDPEAFYRTFPNEQQDLSSHTPQFFEAADNLSMFPPLPPNYIVPQYASAQLSHVVSQYTTPQLSHDIPEPHSAEPQPVIEDDVEVEDWYRSSPQLSRAQFSTAPDHSSQAGVEVPAAIEEIFEDAAEAPVLSEQDEATVAAETGEETGGPKAEVPKGLIIEGNVPSQVKDDVDATENLAAADAPETTSWIEAQPEAEKVDWAVSTKKSKKDKKKKKDSKSAVANDVSSVAGTPNEEESVPIIAEEVSAEPEEFTEALEEPSTIHEGPRTEPTSDSAVVEDAWEAPLTSKKAKKDKKKNKRGSTFNLGDPTEVTESELPSSAPDLTLSNQLVEDKPSTIVADDTAPHLTLFDPVPTAIADESQKASATRDSKTVTDTFESTAPADTTEADESEWATPTSAKKSKKDKKKKKQSILLDEPATVKPVVLQSVSEPGLAKEELKSSEPLTGRQIPVPEPADEAARVEDISHDLHPIPVIQSAILVEDTGPPPEEDGRASPEGKKKDKKEKRSIQLDEPTDAAPIGNDPDMSTQALESLMHPQSDVVESNARDISGELEQLIIEDSPADVGLVDEDEQAMPSSSQKRQDKKKRKSLIQDEPPVPELTTPDAEAGSEELIEEPAAIAEGLRKSDEPHATTSEHETTSIEAQPVLEEHVENDEWSSPSASQKKKKDKKKKRKSTILERTDEESTNVLVTELVTPMIGTLMQGSTAFDDDPSAKVADFYEASGAAVNTADPILVKEELADAPTLTDVAEGMTLDELPRKSVSDEKPSEMFLTVSANNVVDELEQSNQQLSVPTETLHEERDARTASIVEPSVVAEGAPLHEEATDTTREGRDFKSLQGYDTEAEDPGTTFEEVFTAETDSAIRASEPNMLEKAAEDEWSGTVARMESKKGKKKKIRKSIVDDTAEPLIDPALKSAEIEPGSLIKAIPTDDATQSSTTTDQESAQATEQYQPQTNKSEETTASEQILSAGVESIENEPAKSAVPVDEEEWTIPTPGKKVKKDKKKGKKSRSQSVVEDVDDTTTTRIQTVEPNVTHGADFFTSEDLPVTSEPSESAPSKVSDQDPTIGRGYDEVAADRDVAEVQVQAEDEWSTPSTAKKSKKDKKRRGSRAASIADQDDLPPVDEVAETDTMLAERTNIKALNPTEPASARKLEEDQTVQVIDVVPLDSTDRPAGSAVAMPEARIGTELSGDLEDQAPVVDQLVSRSTAFEKQTADEANDEWSTFPPSKTSMKDQKNKEQASTVEHSDDQPPTVRVPADSIEDYYEDKTTGELMVNAPVAPGFPQQGLPEVADDVTALLHEAESGRTLTDVYESFGQNAGQHEHMNRDIALGEAEFEESDAWAAAPEDFYHGAEIHNLTEHDLPPHLPQSHGLTTSAMLNEPELVDQIVEDQEKLARGPTSDQVVESNSGGLSFEVSEAAAVTASAALLDHDIPNAETDEEWSVPAKKDKKDKKDKKNKKTKPRSRFETPAAKTREVAPIGESSRTMTKGTEAVQDQRMTDGPADVALEIGSEPIEMPVDVSQAQNRALLEHEVLPVGTTDTPVEPATEFTREIDQDDGVLPSKKAKKDKKDKKTKRKSETVEPETDLPQPSVNTDTKPFLDKDIVGTPPDQYYQAGTDDGQQDAISAQPLSTTSKQIEDEERSAPKIGKKLKKDKKTRRPLIAEPGSDVAIQVEPLEQGFLSPVELTNESQAPAESQQTIVAGRLLEPDKEVFEPARMDDKPPITPATEANVEDERALPSVKSKKDKKKKKSTSEVTSSYEATPRESLVSTTESVRHDQGSSMHAGEILPNFIEEAPTSTESGLAAIETFPIEYAPEDVEEIRAGPTKKPEKDKNKNRSSLTPNVNTAVSMDTPVLTEAGLEPQKRELQTEQDILIPSAAVVSHDMITTEAPQAAETGVEDFYRGFSPRQDRQVDESEVMKNDDHRQHDLTASDNLESNWTIVDQSQAKEAFTGSASRNPESFYQIEPAQEQLVTTPRSIEPETSLLSRTSSKKDKKAKKAKGSISPEAAVIDTSLKDEIKTTEAAEGESAIPRKVSREWAAQPVATDLSRPGEDSDGSQVSETTRERRRQRRSPQMWTGHEPDDLPRPARDRALTPPPDHDDLMDTALGIAAGLGLSAVAGANEPRLEPPHDLPAQDAGGWSFAGLNQPTTSVRDSGVQFQDSPVAGYDTFARDRDSGFVSSPRGSQQEGKQSMHEDMSLGRSLRPPRPRSATSSAGSDNERGEYQSMPAGHYGTPLKQKPTPVESTSKERDSALFKSSPAGPAITPKIPEEFSHLRSVSSTTSKTPTELAHLRSASSTGNRRTSPSLRMVRDSHGNLRESTVSPSSLRAQKDSYGNLRAAAGSPLSPRSADRDGGLASNLLDRVQTRDVERQAFSPSPRQSNERPFSPRQSIERVFSPRGSGLRTIDENTGLALGAPAALGIVGGAALMSRERTRGSFSKSRTNSLRNLREASTSPSQQAIDGRTADRSAFMAESFDGYGVVNASPQSPSRPPSLRKRQSLNQVLDLQQRVEQLAEENRALAEQKLLAERHIEELQLESSKGDYATEEALKTVNEQLRLRDDEILRLRGEIDSLAAARDALRDEHEDKYTLLLNEKDAAHSRLQESTRELDDLQGKHNQVSKEVEGVVAAQVAAIIATKDNEFETAVASKDAELQKLRRELDIARAKIRDLQSKILSRGVDEVVQVRDEDYFDNACQQLCQHVQQWVLRFSKFSDTRVCRSTDEVRDEKIVDRFDNAILDGSEVDHYLGDRVKRRDVFMSVVMTMIWEFVFTRYLFGMDRDQRQKLKQLEKNLAEVGPANAVQQWRALTLTLLAKRQAFKTQKESDTEAVATEILQTLSKFLPPPQNLEAQIFDSMKNVMRAAVKLSIEMRTQKAEYIMLPPLQPEYDTNGDLARQVFFNASLMNERSGETSSNDELQAQQAVVRMVLFPLVVKKEGEEEIVVCPAQVLVARSDKGKKPRRSGSGREDRERAQSRMSQAAMASTHSFGAMSGVEGNVI